MIFGASASLSETVSYRFVWIGNGGYLMEGAMAFDAGLMSQNRVYEKDLTCFEIQGYLDGRPIGRWALGMLLPETTWKLSFDPVASHFDVWGPDQPMPQAWNMDGFGYNCGSPGFGFNIGGAAQDLCIDQQLIFASQVTPSRPFKASVDPNIAFGKDACLPSLFLSQSHGKAGDYASLVANR